MLSRIKGLLGICQCKKCWNRAYANMEIRQINKSIKICEKHLDKFMEGATLTEINYK